MHSLLGQCPTNKTTKLSLQDLCLFWRVLCVEEEAKSYILLCQLILVIFVRHNAHFLSLVSRKILGELTTGVPYLVRLVANSASECLCDEMNKGKGAPSIYDLLAPKLSFKTSPSNI